MKLKANATHFWIYRCNELTVNAYWTGHRQPREAHRCREAG